jgi:hypothetical protein
VRKRTIVRVAAVSATLAAVAAALPADAVPAKAPQVSDPIAEGLAGPLQLSVNKHGIAVAQSFAATVSKVRPNGTLKNLVTESGEGADIGGVLLTRTGVAYTTTKGSKAKLKFVTNAGEVHSIANLWKYEEEANPDQGNNYGFRHISPSCEDDWNNTDTDPDTDGVQPPPPANYDGIVESHPYALAKAQGGGWYVADAAGNDVVHVNRNGLVRAVAVFSPQKQVITQDDVDALGAPDCIVGKTYWAEPVPTDVEALGGGNIALTLLPGGLAEGANGKVVRVNPSTGVVHTLASGFVGATNLAVSDNGRRIYVANLFGGFISKLTVGGTAHYVDLPSPAALEWYNGKLYTGYDVFGPSGKIATIG